MQKVLIIDDDARLAEMVGTYLRGQGLEVQAAPDGKSGIHAARSGALDCVLLDVMLPDIDGFEVCRRLRAEGFTVPILMLTARGDELDRIIGLEIGADDYLPKPFNPRELLARIRAVTRRGQAAATTERLVFGELVIDRSTRLVIKGGEEVQLTSHQFDLLWALAKRAGRVLSREQLMEAVRGEPLAPFDRSIDVHISRIRSAIEADPKKPRWLVTVRGVGYVFTDRS